MFRLLLRLSLVSLVASLISHHGLLFPKRRSLVSLSLFEKNNEKYSDQSGKPDSPSRFDTCLLLTDGIIGMEPKDVYLKNGHHVMNFPMAFVGHYEAQHEWERYKPTETMWVSAEIWDDSAKLYRSQIKKGGNVKCVGHLISNKWTDKNSGEERKQFRYRISRILSEKEFVDITNYLESDSATNSRTLSTEDDSSFSSEISGGNSIESPTHHSTTLPSSALQKKQFSSLTKDATISSRSTDSGASRSHYSSSQSYPTWDTLENFPNNSNDFWQ